MKSTDLKRAALSLTAILATYWCYTTCVVPLIEPPSRQKSVSSSHVIKQGPRFADRYRPQLQVLFGADGWQSQSPKVLRHRNTLLLFQEYSPQKDGTLKLEPCTVVLWRDGEQTVEQAASAIVMDAPDGAVLQLSKPINLRSGQLGQPVAGRLDGPIRIRSRGRADGSGRLNLVTSDLQINARENFLWTPNAVEIEYEQHHAQGRDLTIKLAPSKSRSSSRSGNSWAGMRSIELVHLDHLHLEVEPEVDESNAAEVAPSTPVDVTCSGPLEIDFVQRFLTLEDQVQLRRRSEQGVIDTLSCDRLQLAFQTTDAKQAEPPKGRSGSVAKQADSRAERWRRLPKLEVKQVVAEGNPVVLDVVSRDTQIRGRRLSYDLQAGRFWLTPSVDDAADRVWLRQQQHQVEARELDCRLSSKGQIRRVVAKGPGRFRGMLTGNTAQPVEADWEEVLVFEQESEGLHRLTVRRKARVQIGATDGIAADTLQVWFEPDPVSNDRGSEEASLAGSLQIRPQRLLATAGDEPSDSIVLQSKSVIGTTRRLDARFEHVPLPSSTQPVSRATPRFRPASSQRARNRSNREPSSEPTENAATTTRVAGERLDVVLRVSGRDVSVSQLLLQNQVQLWQEENSRAGFQLTADRVQINESDGSSQVVTAIGNPVQIRSDRMTLQTAELSLDQKRNLVWSEQPGRMTVLVDRDAQGNPIATPQEMTIDWLQRMDFDGKWARFRGQVEVRGSDQRVRAEQVEVALNQQFRFDRASRSGTPIDLQQVRAQGNVHIDTRQYEQDKLSSVTYMRVPFAQFNRETGDMLAGGPGRVVTVRDGFRGSLDPARPGERTVRPAPRPADGRLTFLQVDYQKEIRGNLNRRIVDFHERVKVIYGPVVSWNETLRADGTLRENDVLLSCEKLTVAQGSLVGPGEQATLDMIAEGNTYVEGQAFTARGERVSYEQAKDLLVLEGAGNTDAVLSHQARAGASRSETAARKILYWPATRRVKVDSARYLDFGF